jgi:Rhodopirellula transposase DDE domain
VFSYYIDDMVDTGIIEVLRRKFTRLASELDERGRRRWAASEALELGHGGIKVVAQATGLGERTIRRGCQALRHEQAPASPAGRRIRHAGGGRKPLQTHDPALVSALEALVEPTTRGDPMSPLRWTCKSTRTLATALTDQGHKISHTTVAQWLADLDYSLQGTRKP